MPALVGGAELEALGGKVQGATQERMLREMADARIVVGELQMVRLCNHSGQRAANAIPRIPPIDSPT